VDRYCRAQSISGDATSSCTELVHHQALLGRYPSIFSNIFSLSAYFSVGEIRAGLPDALSWVVQDDGIGFPCFYNVETQQTVYEDPRFVYEVDDNTASQRRYVMQELRIAVYFCQDMWEKYTAAVSVGDKRQVAKCELEIRNSPKPIHLSSFLIRARALYKQTSVVDKPMDKVILEELDYAAWLVERMASVTDATEQRLMERRDHKRKVVDQLTANSGARVFCVHCKRETKRHLEYCPTCGKPQVVFATLEMIENGSVGGGSSAGSPVSRKLGGSTAGSPVSRKLGSAGSAK
jgi:hypothetical protein